MTRRSNSDGLHISRPHIACLFWSVVGFLVLRKFCVIPIITTQQALHSVYGSIFYLTAWSLTMAITWALTDIGKADDRVDEYRIEAKTPTTKRGLINWLPCPGRDDDQDSTCSTGISTRFPTPSLSPDLHSTDHPLTTPPRNVEDFVTCQTMVKSPWACYVVAELSFFTLVFYCLATYPVYGYACLPIGILSYCGIANMAEMCKLVISGNPKLRWLLAIGATVVLDRTCRTRSLEFKGPFRASDGNVAASLLLAASLAGLAVYFLFTLGCSLQCCLKRTTLPSPKTLNLVFKSKGLIL